MSNIIAAGVAFLLSAVMIRTVLLTPRVRERVLSAPVSDRWHTSPTPSFGGVPMFIAVVIAVVASGALGDRKVQALLVGAAVLFVVGIVDDLRNISSNTKLAGQVIGALAVLAIAAESLDLTPLFALSTLVLVVLIANSVNLLDNMDGLAGSTSVVSLMILLPVLLRGGEEGLGLMTAAVVGSVLGFLMFNLSPARVFMGDAGSLWLGLVVAATAAFADYGARSLTALVIITILAVLVIDTGVVIISRLRNGFSITRGGLDHVSHRLVSLGLSERQAVWVLALAAAFCGAVALAEVFLSTTAWLMTVGALWTGLVIVAAALLRVPVYQAGVSPSSALSRDELG